MATVLNYIKNKIEITHILTTQREPSNLNKIIVRLINIVSGISVNKNMMNEWIYH